MFRKWFSILSIVVTLAVVFSLNVQIAEAKAPTYIEYKVQRGDSLGKIALEHCTTWQEIYNLNRDTIGKDPNIIATGMVLHIPAFCGSAVQLPESPEAAVTDGGPRSRAMGKYNAPYYTIAWGDNLFSIGLRFGLDWQDIAEANSVEGSLIYANRVLFIPGGAVGVAPPDEEEILERVNFKAGSSSASLTGVISEGVYKSYVLWGRRGQTISIETVSHGEPLVISVGNTRGDLLPLTGTNSQIRNNVSAVLPESTDFIVTIRPKIGPESPQLAVDITFTIK